MSFDLARARELCAKAEYVSCECSICGRFDGFRANCRFVDGAIDGFCDGCDGERTFTKSPFVTLLPAACDEIERLNKRLNIFASVIKRTLQYLRSPDAEDAEYIERLLDDALAALQKGQK